METQLLTLKNDPTRRFAGIQYSSYDENLQNKIHEFIDDSVLYVDFSQGGIEFNLRNIPGDRAWKPFDRTGENNIERGEWFVRELIDKHDTANVAIVSNNYIEKYYDTPIANMYDLSGDYVLKEFKGSYRLALDDYGKHVIVRNIGENVLLDTRGNQFKFASNVIAYPSHKVFGSEVTVINGGDDNIEFIYQLKPGEDVINNMPKWDLKPDHYIKLCCETDEVLRPVDMGKYVRKREPNHTVDFDEYLRKWGVKS